MVGENCFSDLEEGTVPFLQTRHQVLFCRRQRLCVGVRETCALLRGLYPPNSTATSSSSSSSSSRNSLGKLLMVNWPGLVVGLSVLIQLSQMSPLWEGEMWKGEHGDDTYLVPLGLMKQLQG